MTKKLLVITAGILILAGGLFAASGTGSDETVPINHSGWVEGSRLLAEVDPANSADPMVLSYWSTSGNSGTTPGTHFLGTTDNQALEIMVYGNRVFRLEPESYSPHITGGYSGNTISSGCYGAVISGGGRSSYVNQITGDGQYSVIGGGSGNYISDFYSTISGGAQNQATENYTSIGGGTLNTASGPRSTIGGGQNNISSGSYSVASGGYGNTAGNSLSVVGGGGYNTASGSYSTVPGGYRNEATASYALAAGNRAKANHLGSFVWGDGQSADIASTGNHQFIVRSAGGVWFGTNSSPSWPSGSFIATSTGAYLSSGGTWTNASDRNLKEGFEEVDEAEILTKVAELPITSWNYKIEDRSVTHIGPVAQDFHTAFNLGADERSISTVDADGVALASIQALYAENQELKAQLKDLEARLDALEKR